MEELAALVVASPVEDLVVGAPQVTEGRAEGLDGHVRAEHAAVAAEDLDHPPEPRADRLDVPRGEDRAEGIEAGAETALPTYVNGDLDRLTAQVVYEAAHDGDEYALEVVRDTAKFLGAGVANVINIFNPEVVVICGGVTLAGARLFDPLRSEVKRRAFKPAVEVCRIVPGDLTGTAGVYGAAAVFLRHTWGKP